MKSRLLRAAALVAVLLASSVAAADANQAVTLRNGSLSTVLQSDANGGFALESMPLTIGSNTLGAQARDQAGNLSTTASVSVLRQGFVGAALSGRLDGRLQ